MLLKNIEGEKSHLFAYLRFCAFAWVSFCLWCFWYVQNLFAKKKKSPNNLIYITTYSFSGELKKVTKIKLVRVLAKSFDKSHHLDALHIFGYCFVVP